jgi:hypothetical protein
MVFQGEVQYRKGKIKIHIGTQLLDQGVDRIPLPGLDAKPYTQLYQSRYKPAIISESLPEKEGALPPSTAN